MGTLSRGGLQCPYLVGDIYITTRSENPSSLWQGTTWSQISSEKDLKYVGSILLHDGLSGSGSVSKTGLIGAYYDGMFRFPNAPNGYHKSFKVSFQGTTSDNNSIDIYLNNLLCASINTWSATTFKEGVISPLLKNSDIQLTTTLNYSTPGINLYYGIRNSGSWQFQNVLYHQFYESDDTFNKWKRLS